jgi:hypothetical protein
MSDKSNRFVERGGAWVVIQFLLTFIPRLGPASKVCL